MPARSLSISDCDYKWIGGCAVDEELCADHWQTMGFAASTAEASALIASSDKQLNEQCRVSDSEPFLLEPDSDPQCMTLCSSFRIA